MSVSVKQRPRKSQEQRTRIFKKTTTAADRLRSDIREGVFKPGQWVNKEKVGRGYGVGITSMETACQALVKEGLLEARKWQTRTTYYVPEPKPTLESVPANLLAEARASVALDGETRSLEVAAGRVRSTGRKTLVEVVTDMLRQDLAEGKYPLGSFMPTQTTLARELGTNQNAVWRAMTALKQEGLVESHSGAPAMVVALPSQPAKPTPTESAVTMAQSLSEEDEPTEKGVTGRQPSKQMTVRQYIIDKIEDGTYAAGTLMPSLQVMANGTGAGYQTVAYVYERLHSQGYIAKNLHGHWVVAAKPASTPAEEALVPPDEDEPKDLISASEVLPIIRALSDENRQLRAAQETIKNVAERLSGYEEEIKRLRGQVAEERGNARRLDEENAELRGKLHRRNGTGRVIHTFGSEFKNGVGWSDADAAHIKDLMAAPKGAKAQ